MYHKKTLETEYEERVKKTISIGMCIHITIAKYKSALTTLLDKPFFLLQSLI
jgi:hypothetical protein